ncbi:MAG TPA: hypothetical protein VGM02_01425 [Acidobacteriaceae bacterium]
MEKTKSYRISDFTALEFACRDCGSKMSFPMSRERAESEIKAAMFGRRTCAACGSMWITHQNDARYQALTMIVEGLFEARRQEAMPDDEVSNHHDVPGVLVSLVINESD